MRSWVAVAKFDVYKPKRTRPHDTCERERGKQENVPEDSLKYQILGSARLTSQRWWRRTRWKLSPTSQTQRRGWSKIKDKYISHQTRMTSSRSWQCMCWGKLPAAYSNHHLSQLWWMRQRMSLTMSNQWSSFGGCQRILKSMKNFLEYTKWPPLMPRHWQQQPRTLSAEWICLYPRSGDSANLHK